MDRAELEKLIGKEIPDDVWKFLPLGRRLVVLRDPPEHKVGLIYIPDNATEPLSTGVVISAGPWVGREGTGLGNFDAIMYVAEEAVGHRFLFGKYAGTPLHQTSYESEEFSEYILMQEMDIQGEVL